MIDLQYAEGQTDKDRECELHLQALLSFLGHLLHLLDQEVQEVPEDQSVPLDQDLLGFPEI